MYNYSYKLIKIQKEETNMKINKILLGTLFIAAGLTLAACGNSQSSSQNQLQSIKSSGTMTVALSADYPPFEYQTIKNGKNEIVGSDVDLANAIGKALGVKVKISNMDFNNVLTSVASGKADIAISGISYTPQRAQSYDFSTIYYDSPNVIIIKKSDLNKYKSLSDFSGKNIAAQKGSIQEQMAQTEIKGATEVSLPQIGDEVNELNAGKVQGAVVEKLIAQSYIEANPQLTMANVEVPALTKNYGMAVAMPKGSTALKAAVDKVISQMKSDGSLNKSIEDNYKLSQNTK